jgi:hypothetical protein
MIILIFLSLFSYSAETPYGCKQYQSDIDYWQEQYRLVVKDRDKIEIELSELRLKQPTINPPRLIEEIENIKISYSDYFDD